MREHIKRLFLLTHGRRILLLCVALAGAGFFSPTVTRIVSGTNITATNNGGAVTVDLNSTLTGVTLTSPTITSPTLSGTTAGTATLGGTLTLGANIAAAGNSITGLGASSGIVQGGAEIAPSINTTYYMTGVGNSTARTTDRVLYQAPAARVIQNCSFYCGTCAGAGTVTFTVRRFSGSWASTAITCATASPTFTCRVTGTSQALSAGDFVGFQFATNGSVGGGSTEFVGACEVTP